MSELQPLTLRERQASELFSVSRPTFRHWVREGIMPEGKMIGGCRLWHIDVLKQAAEKFKPDGGLSGGPDE